jgi:phosphonate transport system ATP-binding protein
VEDKLWLRCDRLSGGERQRVGLARAWLSVKERAKLLLLDEPVSALDPALGLAAIQALQKVAGEQNVTLIASLHDIQLARHLFPRLIGLKAGVVQFDLPAAQVTDNVLVDLYGDEFAHAASMVHDAQALPQALEMQSSVIATGRCF